MHSGDTSISTSRYVKLQSCFIGSTTSVGWVLENNSIESGFLYLLPFLTVFCCYVVTV